MNFSQRLKLFALVLFSAYNLTVIAQTSPSLVLDFHYGNQIVGSYLKIYSDGSILHQERTCCPPKISTVPQENLTSAKLAELKAWIAKAKNEGEIKITTGGPSVNGSKIGEHYVFTESNEKVIIHLIEQNRTEGGRDKVSYNNSPAAQSVESLVDTCVKHPMK